MTNILSLPVKIREIIYGYVWCHNRYVRFGVQSIEDSWTKYEGPTFPEEPSSKYPPAASKSQVKVRPASASAPSGSDESEKASSGCVIDFDVQAFLKANEEWNDETKQRKRYKLDCFTPVNVALFHVSSQFYRESRAVFYGERTFVFDSCGIDAIRFLNSLPNRIRSNITFIGLTGYIFMGDDEGSLVAWSGSTDEPKYLKDGLPLHTPFAAFLASKMPNLQEIYYYFPYCGEEDYYATWAPKELSMMLMYGRIQHLCHVFLGDKAKEALERYDSEKCHGRLMGDWADGGWLANYRWQLVDEGPRSSDKKDVNKWVDDQLKFVKENKRMFPWEWAGRDIDMGADGNVQAVIACTR